MVNLNHDEILAVLPAKYRALVDGSTARGMDLDAAIIYALSVMARCQPELFKAIQNKLEHKH